MNYITVSPFWAFEEIEKGKVIYVADKQAKECFILNDMTAEAAVTLTKDAKARSDKYEFWYEEEKKVTEDAELR